MTEPAFLTSTRAAYDVVAAHADQFDGDLASRPLDRAMLAAFAELVRTTNAGPVADVGCGTGQVTAHLHALGLDVFGVDLSPGMVEVARRAHPGLRFDVGSMTELDLPDGTLGGIVARYSLIHIPPERQPAVLAEFHRVLAPGGHLLLAFQTGDERLHRTEAFGQPISLDAYRLPPDRTATLVERAGLVVHARLVREPNRPAEKVPQACLMARRPA